MAMYLCASPLGVGAGALISENTYDYALLIIQALSAGTFVYLSCVDLIVHEFQHSEIPMTKKIKLIKLLSLFGGWVFVVMLITALPDHEGK